MLLNFVNDQLPREYLFFTYLLCLSTLQIVATVYRLRGMTVLPPPWGVPIGVMTAIGDLAWFFWSGDRNTIGLAGWEMFLLFVMGAVGALWTSLTLSSLLWRPERRSPPAREGVDALRHMTYWEAIESRWSR
jgi:hypothetical protein